MRPRNLCLNKTAGNSEACQILKTTNLEWIPIMKSLWLLIWFSHLFANQKTTTKETPGILFLHLQNGCIVNNAHHKYFLNSKHRVYVVGINKHQLKLVMEDNTNEPCNENNNTYFFQIERKRHLFTVFGFLIKLFMKSPNGDHTLKRMRFHI